MDLPEPITAAECDLQDFPFMPLHVARLRDSDLAAEEHPETCWYAVLLWAAAWHQIPAGSLPDNDLVLMRLAGLGRDDLTWKTHKDGALRGFIACSDGRLYHPVVAEQANNAWAEKLAYRERKEKRVEAASKAANVRWRGESQSDGNADRMQVASTLECRKGEGQGQGYIPLSNDNGAVEGSDKAFWDNAKMFLGKSKAGMIGKWCRDYGKEATAKAITEAQVNRAVDPSPYIEKVLRMGGGSRGGFDRPC